MEEEFIRNQERLKPQDEKNEEERSKVDDLRGYFCFLGPKEKGPHFKNRAQRGPDVQLEHKEHYFGLGGQVSKGKKV